MKVINRNIIEIFKYCPKCAYELGQNREKRLVDCRFCGLYYYINPIPTVAVLFENRKKQILAVKRKFPPAKGKWDLPGGFIDFNENMEKAINREVKEELGISVNKYFYIGSSTDNYHFKGVLYKVLSVLYTSEIDGKIYPADDVASYKFFERKLFPYKEFGFPGLADLVRNFLNKREGGE